MPRNISYGRGGAGNISSSSEQTAPDPKDLVTPTIKQDVYTTGRGGSGNMVQNDPQHPEIAREAQDVGAPLPPARSSPYLGGRGGAGNTYTPQSTPQEEEEQPSLFRTLSNLIGKQEEPRKDSPVSES